MEHIDRSPRPRIPAIVLAAAAASLMAVGAVSAASTASSLPPTWHIHDGQGATLGSQHKGIGFFPTILGVSTATYLEDPARCPDATDKAFLDSADTSDSDVLRAGMCQTDTQVIHLRTVPVGTAGPDGWASITTASEPGFVTYYLVVAR
jgi:hypothetical protein